MIARTWRGRTTSEDGPRYAQYVHETGISGLRAIPGNLAAMLFLHDDGEIMEHLVVSLWDSQEAIERFAGADTSRAVYYPEDDQYLLEMPDHVTHYEVDAFELEPTA